MPKRTRSDHDVATSKAYSISSSSGNGAKAWSSGRNKTMVASLRLEDKLLVQEGCSVMDISTWPQSSIRSIAADRPARCALLCELCTGKRRPMRFKEGVG